MLFVSLVVFRVLVFVMIAIRSAVAGVSNFLLGFRISALKYITEFLAAYFQGLII